MSKSLKRLLSLVLSAVMLMTSFIAVNVATTTVSAATSPYILKQDGWLESAYVEWTSVPGAEGYAAYIKEASAADSAYERLDNELIRKYSDCFRADALGLKAGSYVIKVVPVVGSKFDESKAFVTDTLEVLPHDRSGAAFSSKSTNSEGVGAYNNDGTPKADAQILYVTAKTAKTVTAMLYNDKGTAKTEYKGLQTILDRKQKNSKLDKHEPLIIRILGKVTKSDLDKISSSEEGLQIKGDDSYYHMDVTVEGVGEDAVVSGFGFLARNCKNVEFRNFAIMDFMDDGISLDTGNENIWVHNMEFFYGGPGGDADQAKGDGTVDLKGGTRYTTISYNHFYDSGKASLCGMGGDGPSITNTYHHNWFDHSDSRMPRVREMSIHVYNNYFDGISKYGVGSADGSSIFVQNNYFNNCRYPAITGNQGHDVDSSDHSTLSGENGGVIKMFGNFITGAEGYTTYQQDPKNFDAYEASSAGEKIPSSVSAKGGSYNNFDTDSAFDLHALDLDEAVDVPAKVMKYAGRVNGGDFFATTGKNRSDFPGLTDAKSYDVDQALKSAVVNYQSPLDPNNVGGTNVSGEVEERTTVETSTQSTTQTVETSTQATTQAAPSVNTKPVDKGAAEDNSGEDSGKISVTYDAATDKYTLKDSSSTLAATLNIPTKETIKSGKVVVKGTVTPAVSKPAGSWALVSVTGPKAADGTYPEIAAFASNGDKALTLRVNNDKDNGLSSKTITFEPNKEYSYEFLFDLDAKTVTLTVDGTTIENKVPLTLTEIGGWATITAKSATDRGIVASTPYIGIESDDPVTTETSTQPTTSAPTTKPAEETTKPSEETTKPSTEPTTTDVYGDANADGTVDINDVPKLFEYVSKGIANMTEAFKDKIDLDQNGSIDSADVAILLQHILDSNYTLPLKKSN